MEHDNIYRGLDTSTAWDAEVNRPAVGQVVKSYLCPSRHYAGLQGIPALADYVGVAGIGADAATLPGSDPRSGFFGYDRTIRLSDIKDGASNTLMAIETASVNGPWAAGGTATVRAFDPETQPYVGNGRPFGLSHVEWTILGRPSVGANAAFADGSVRYLRDSISPHTLEALATIAGGDKIDDDL